MSWTEGYRRACMSASEAVKLVTSGARVTLSGNAGVPRVLLDALCARSGELRDVEVMSLLTLGDAPWARPGAGVVTSRGDVHFVATEFGIADLWGRSVRERARQLISIAHPEHREQLTAQARARHLL